MSRLDDLRHIAGLVGIGTRHEDGLGVLHEPGEEILGALIAAFGLPTDPAHAAAALAAEQASAPFGLSPTEIVAEEAPVLHLRHDGAQGGIEWHGTFEDGSAAGGRIADGELRLPPGTPPGYHRLALKGADAATEIRLIVAPNCAYLPEGLRDGTRSWGLTTQLYGVRGRRDWGMGDFTDLAQLCRGAGFRGAATVGLNPLHALFAAEPRHFSPYSPSSRNWLDYLYIDATKVPGFDEIDAQAHAPTQAISAARNAELVDYAAVAALKRPVLEALYQRLARDISPTGWGGAAADFRKFVDGEGAGLAAFATFEALHEYFLAQGAEFSWQGWPAAFRDPNSPEVAAFARAHADRIEFFQFLQWQANRQLGAAAEAGRAAGLSIGLYRDLAVGVNPNGADAWADQELVVPGAAIGAPPDPLSRGGQNWGLAPFSPLALKRQGFAPFIAAMRANMRHAGVLRIDHVMSLQRLYWVPTGVPATAGAYINYPFREMLRLVALESQRQHCAVIGEDLGTVPDGFRETMREANVLGYRIMSFEREWDGSFRPSGAYPPLVAASAATHDLATLKGFWLGRDIEWRTRLGNYPDAGVAESEQRNRGRDRHLLLEALIREGLLAPVQYRVFLPENAPPVYGLELGEAILAYLARSPARLTLVQLEDIAGEVEQANLPGTTDDDHPNWRRRLSETLDALLASPAMARVAATVNEARRHALPEDQS